MIARALDTFARWAVKRFPADQRKGSSGPVHFGAYTISTDGSPYLTRVLLPRIFGVRPMLHNIHRADDDRELHNHPWRWMLSIILSGSYDEERTDAAGRVTRRRVRWFNFITDRDFHRIAELHGHVWTLFITGPRVQSWGFLVDGKLIPWRDFSRK